VSSIRVMPHYLGPTTQPVNISLTTNMSFPTSFSQAWPPAPTFDPDRDIVDLTGKVAIVTGGYSGIGYETVVRTTRRGWRGRADFSLHRHPHPPRKHSSKRIAKSTYSVATNNSLTAPLTTWPTTASPNDPTLSTSTSGPIPPSAPPPHPSSQPRPCSTTSSTLQASWSLPSTR
jgi:hypothetical protein